MTPCSSGSREPCARSSSVHLNVISTRSSVTTMIASTRYFVSKRCRMLRTSRPSTTYVNSTTTRAMERAIRSQSFMPDWPCSQRRRLGARRNVDGYDFVEHRQGATCGLAPRERLHSFESQLLHPLAQLAGSRDFHQCLRDVCFVQRIDQARRAAGDLRPGASRRHDGRAAARERLDDRNTEALAQRCQHETFGKVIGEMNARVRHEAEEVHVREIFVGEAARPQVFIDALADHYQRQLAARAAIAPITSQQTLVVAAGVGRHVLVTDMQCARDREDESRRQAMFVTELCE